MPTRMKCVKTKHSVKIACQCLLALSLAAHEGVPKCIDSNRVQVLWMSPINSDFFLSHPFTFFRRGAISFSTVVLLFLTLFFHKSPIWLCLSSFDIERDREKVSFPSFSLSLRVLSSSATHIPRTTTSPSSSSCLQWEQEKAISGLRSTLSISTITKSIDQMRRPSQTSLLFVNESLARRRRRLRKKNLIFKITHNQFGEPSLCCSLGCVDRTAFFSSNAQWSNTVRYLSVSSRKFQGNWACRKWRVENALWRATLIEVHRRLFFISRVHSEAFFRRWTSYRCQSDGSKNQCRCLFFVDRNSDETEGLF